MIPQIRDFQDEVSELSDLLKAVSPEDWMRRTQFKDWTVNDVVLHLYASDHIAMAAARSEAEYRLYRADVLARRADGASMIEESRRRFPSLHGEALRLAWIEQAHELCESLSRRDPELRLPWSGPDMGLKTFAIARQMETWAHGQEVYDILGVERAVHSRIFNIAALGVKTFAWSFKNRGLPAPEQAPYVRLMMPTGEVREWNVPARGDQIEGAVLEFCQVVTQVRNVADTELRVMGDVAWNWMNIAQCFAGPPSDPPPPGMRFKVRELQAS